MNKITFEQYKSAIKVKYEEKKREDISGILLNPTPAQLRNLCLMIFDNLLSKSDENIFRLFFNVKEEESLRKSMEHSDIARFRPIISFLKGEKDSENSTRIELAAILIDFNPRPYNKYLLNVKINEIGKAEVSSLMDENEADDVNDVNLPIDKWVEKESLLKNISFFEKRKAIVFALLISLFFMGYTIKDIVFPKKECMIWNNNHYEAVDCKNEKSGILDFTSVEILNENLLSLKKIEVNKNTIFFKKGKPVVWYGKSVEGNYEYFNQPGLHPETEKTLRPISLYIIKKYLFK
ncbi:hypothetical protein [Flavobacterium sp. 83]|uniref:hypothetical protein n=1 Tax=Flavobacterium sp. 83 TaxID=1131812 RepID=UPI00068FE7FC|nr:hypothetical protein [Flavobacterium sp. 83]